MFIFEISYEDAIKPVTRVVYVVAEDNASAQVRFFNRFDGATKEFKIRKKYEIDNFISPATFEVDYEMFKKLNFA